SQSGQTPKLEVAGVVTVKGTITTSRGQTITRTEDITILPYLALMAGNLLAYRSTSAGVEDDNGTHVRMSFSGLATSLAIDSEKNRMTYTLRTRPRGGTTWTTHSSATGSTNLFPIAIVTPSGFPQGTAY